MCLDTLDPGDSGLTAGVIKNTQFWNPKAGQICQRAKCEPRFLEACTASCSHSEALVLIIIYP